MAGHAGHAGHVGQVGHSGHAGHSRHGDQQEVLLEEPADGAGAEERSSQGRARRRRPSSRATAVVGGVLLVVAVLGAVALDATRPGVLAGVPPGTVVPLGASTARVWSTAAGERADAVDGVVVLTRRDGGLQGRDVATGEVLWEDAGATSPGSCQVLDDRTVGGTRAIACQGVVDDGRGVLAVRDARTGRERWSHEVAGRVAQTALEGTTLVAVTGTAEDAPAVPHRFDVRTGEPVAVDEQPDRDGAAQHDVTPDGLHVRLSFELLGAPVLDVGEADGTVRFTVPGWYRRPAVTATGTGVLLVARASGLVALDDRDGTELWSVDAVDAPLVQLRDRVVLADADGRSVRARSLRTGEELWSWSRVSDRPPYLGGLAAQAVVDGGAVLLAAAPHSADGAAGPAGPGEPGGTLAAVDLADGSTRWELTLGAPAVRVLPVDGHLLVQTEQGVEVHR